MFGLYPAGANWVRHFSPSQDAKSLQKILVERTGLVASAFHQPFGVDRGAVIAQRDNFLVLVQSAKSEGTDVVVTPNVQLQQLLWCFDHGYASQWSERELRALTGSHSWEALLKETSATFAAVCDNVSRAIEGTVVTVDAAMSSEPPIYADSDDIPWLPPEYLCDSPWQEVSSCAL